MKRIENYDDVIPLKAIYTQFVRDMMHNEQYRTHIYSMWASSTSSGTHGVGSHQHLPDEAPLAEPRSLVQDLRLVWAFASRSDST
mmetsp:Transcript_29316/g.53469  ORF Transcript_29316/g.53469 Transcript_29316/m.53469 type:complete len:85 (-) Transcript_29316:14-268(-)